MVEYLGNCNHLVDWDQFIVDLEKKEPMIGYQFDEDRAESLDPAVRETYNLWQTAGYNVTDKTRDNHIAWEAWYSGHHFDTSITDVLCNFLNIQPIDVAMVTKMRPGRFAPWHWDIRNQETIDRFDSYNAPIIRLHIHMNDPQPGHVFIIDDHTFYDEEKGSIYKWPSWRSWHAGSNCGLVPKYQFSIIGIPK
jgi:hypothetical protein